jgi:GR25 family glycosyltransferase involved in LPS biosynthesis
MITTYIINLKERTDRKSYILEEIKKLPLLSYEIIDAIRDETKTCFASHLKCIQLAKDNNLPYILILEDDAMFTNECVSVFNKALTEIQNKQWDMFFLGANLQKPATRVSDTLLKLSGAWAAHAYMVHERFYDTILNLPHICEMDVHYHNLMPNHNIYICDPMIAYQLPSHSDLQDGFRDYNESITENYLKYKN